MFIQEENLQQQKKEKLQGTNTVISQLTQVYEKHSCATAEGFGPVKFLIIHYYST